MAPGTYKEHIKIDKSLVIKGSGETSTIVDGSKTGRVFEIGSTNRSITVTLSDIKIQKGLAVNNNGGGILNSATLMASRCNISRNGATEGGGIYNAPGGYTLMLSNSTIYENTAGNCRWHFHLGKCDDIRCRQQINWKHSINRWRWNLQLGQCNSVGSHIQEHRLKWKRRWALQLG